MTEPQTLLEAVRHFSDLSVCFRYMVELKWPDGKPICPACGGDRIGTIASRSVLQCKDVACRKQFSAKVDTLMEDSPMSISQWFVAIWAAAHGVASSVALARAINTTQSTAWKMLYRIRIAREIAERRNTIVESEQVLSHLTDSTP